MFSIEKQKFASLCTKLSIEQRFKDRRFILKRMVWSRDLMCDWRDRLQSSSFQFYSKALDMTLHRYVLFYNQELPQSVLSSKTALQSMKDWFKVKLKL